MEQRVMTTRAGPPTEDAPTSLPAMTKAGKPKRPRARGVSAKTKRYLTFLTPDRVLDIAYALYVLMASDEQERQTETYAIARSIVAKFRQVCDKHDNLETPEGQFLFSLEQIVVSLSRGINRRKNTLNDRLKAARDKKARQLKEIGDTSFRAGYLKAGWRALFIGGLGFFLAQHFLPNLHLGEDKSPTFASLAIATGAILIFSFVRSIWTNYRFNEVYTAYELARNKADGLYIEEVLQEYVRSRNDAARAWKLYSGRDPEKSLGFEAVLHEDSNRRKIHSPESSALEKVVRTAKEWLKKPWSIRRRKAMEETLLSAEETLDK